MNVCRAPKNEQEFAQYYQLRWQTLRQPWQQPKGSELDSLEQQSIHRAIFDESNAIIAIGRLHFANQHQAQVRYVAVKDGCHGKGLGKQIMLELELIAKHYGAKEIKLKARENAVDFYLALAYQLKDFSHLLYDEIKHFTMVKLLSFETAKHQQLAKKLQDTWHNTIAVSKAMNIEVCLFDGERILTSCDHQFNKNLHQTMFAGSIYTLATLTGWGWVYCQLALLGLDADIVLADANIRYKKPLKGVAQAVTSTSSTTGDLTTIKERGKARITLQVNVSCGEEVVATFNGVYFAMMKKEEL